MKLYPNKGQEAQLQAIIDGSRFVYNHFLEQRKNHYLEHKKTISYAVMARELTKLRYQVGFLKPLQTEPLQQSLRRLDKAYNSFFRKTAKFPKFKSRFDARQSFQKHQAWRVVGNRIQIQKDLQVKYRGQIDDTATLGTLVILKESGKWYATTTAKVEYEIPKKYGKPVGIDVGLETLATLSTGQKFANIQPQKTLQSKLTRAQRVLARKKKGSKRRQLAKVAVNKIYAKIRHKRENHIHQVSSSILKDSPSLVAVEDLNVAGMMKNRHLSRALGDASLRILLKQLKYKQEWRGGTYAEIGRFFPSSKTCHKCGCIADKMPLSVRKWKCQNCGTLHDRDINAAKVILAQASVQDARGGKVRPSRHSPVKRK